MSSHTGGDCSLMPPAKRWRLSIDDWIWDTATVGGHANISLNSAAGDSDNWGWSVGQQAYFRKPGTRDDILSYSQDPDVGIVVRNKDQSTSEFRKRIPGFQTQYLWWPTKHVDTHGNSTIITYSVIGGITRPTQITDASGVRYLQLNWITTNPSRLNYVRLVYPGGTRQWDFE